MTQKQLAADFNKKFNTNYSWHTIGCKRRDLGISGVCNKFTKGHRPWNTGVPMSPEVYEKCKKTMFKKGQKPVNHDQGKPLYTEVTDKAGVVWIKIQKGKGFRNWVKKARYIYEKTYGKLPEGMTVIHLDGNVSNDEINNLKALPKKVAIRMASNHLYFNNKELTETGIKIAEIYAEVGKKSRKEKKK